MHAIALTAETRRNDARSLELDVQLQAIDDEISQGEGLAGPGPIFWIWFNQSINRVIDWWEADLCRSEDPPRISR
jgi:hypothetical protein